MISLTGPLGLGREKVWLKGVIFSVFFFGDNDFFTNRTNSPQNSESLMSEVANALKWTLFSVRSLKILTPALSQIFSVTPIF